MRTRQRVSSLPSTSVIFQICGPRAAPTRQIRNAFITIPTPYSFSAIQGIIKLSKPSADQSSCASRSASISVMCLGLSSFQRFLSDFSSYSVGATKKKLTCSQSSETKFTRSLVRPITFATTAASAVTPLASKYGINCSANSSLDLSCKYWWLNHLPFS